MKEKLDVFWQISSVVELIWSFFKQSPVQHWQKSWSTSQAFKFGIFWKLQVKFDCTISFELDFAIPFEPQMAFRCKNIPCFNETYLQPSRANRIMRNNFNASIVDSRCSRMQELKKNCKIVSSSWNFSHFNEMFCCFCFLHFWAEIFFHILRLNGSFLSIRHWLKFAKVLFGHKVEWIMENWIKSETFHLNCKVSEVVRKLLSAYGRRLIRINEGNVGKEASRRLEIWLKLSRRDSISNGNWNFVSMLRFQQQKSHNNFLICDIISVDFPFLSIPIDGNWRFLSFLSHETPVEETVQHGTWTTSSPNC